VLREAAGTAGAAQVAGERLREVPAGRQRAAERHEPDRLAAGPDADDDASVSAELDAGS
jgi:hypothetical protein